MQAQHIQLTSRELTVRPHSEEGLARRTAVTGLTMVLAMLDVALALTAIAPLLAPIFAGGLP